MLILNYEDLKTNPSTLIKNVFSFLDVDDQFIPNCINTNIKHKKDTSTNLFIDKDDIQKVKDYYGNYDFRLIIES